MSIQSKPEGYSSVSPYLVAEGAQRVIDFLKQTFGASELRRYDMPDGSIMHAEVRIDDTVIMIADGGGQCPYRGYMSMCATSTPLTSALSTPAGCPSRNHNGGRAIRTGVAA
jgi:uncharacterized glyoxalase superfamily protein PhnB